MAEALDTGNAAFWLPASFLTDDEDDEPQELFLSSNKDEFLFSNSSIDSPLSSTETERGDGDDFISTSGNKGEDFVSELTRHLAQSSLHDSLNTEKPWKLSTSPQSTLTGFGAWTTRSGLSSNGSPNGPPSPPLTPPAKNDAAWELLYEAAGQVARLKMNALAAELNNQQNRGLLGAPRNVSFSSKPLHHHQSSFYDFPQFEQVKRQGNGNLFSHQHNHNQRSCCSGGPPLGLSNSAWPPLRPNHHRHHHQHHHRHNLNGGMPGVRSVFHTGLGPGPGPMPGMKKQSTGTGVFIPRRAGSNGPTITTHQPQQAPEFSKKPMGVNLNPRNRFGSGLLAEKEIIMARRNLVMEQQRRSFIGNDEIGLPRDWTY